MLPSSPSSTVKTVPLPRLSMVLTALLLLLLGTCMQSVVEGRRMTKREVKDSQFQTQRLLRKMVEAVERASDFFAADYSNINLDGVFGIRVGQGQIVEAVRECQNSASCPAELRSRLETLNKETDVTSSAALGYVESQDPEYLKRFLPVVNKAYVVRYQPVLWTDVDTGPQQTGSDHHYNEDAGDLCYARIFGTLEENGKAVARCNVTEGCWAMMMKNNTSGYSITHQLLYFILIEKTGCVEVLEQETKTDVRETEERLCRSIYNEAGRGVKDGAVAEMWQDLFLEEVLLCGILGFENFMRRDWMRMALTWQMPSGCFSNDALPDMRESARSQPASTLQEQEEARLLMRNLQREAQMIESRYRSRQILRESMMSDGCLAHKTGLGFGVLSVYTRYLLRQLYLSQ